MTPACSRGRATTIRASTAPSSTAVCAATRHRSVRCATTRCARRRAPSTGHTFRNSYVGDFNGDEKDDLFVFNWSDWAIPYFALLRSTGTSFECIRRFDEELPGWDDMKRHDEFFVADFNDDGRDDIFVFNGQETKT